jgi:hypothetical protein
MFAHGERAFAQVARVSIASTIKCDCDPPRDPPIDAKSPLGFTRGCISVYLLFTRRNLGSKGLGNYVLVLFVFFFKQEAAVDFLCICVYGPRFFCIGAHFAFHFGLYCTFFYTIFTTILILCALRSRAFARITFVVRTGTHSTRARVLVLRFILLNYGHGRGFPCLSGRCSRAAPNVFDPPPPSFPFPNFISAPKKSSKLSKSKNSAKPFGTKRKVVGEGRSWGAAPPT